MKIIVVGAGKTGMGLVKNLTDEGHEVVMLDYDAQKVTEVCNCHDVMGVVGNGMSFSLLEEAGLSEADVLITVTGSDEQNLLCSLFAKKVENCSTIARVRNPIYIRETEFLRNRIGLSLIINPEYSAAAEIYRLLKFPSAIDINTFAKGKAEMLTFKIVKNSVLDGKNLTFVRSKIESDILVCCVERGGEYHIPSGDFVLCAGDKATIIIPPRKSLSFFKKIKVETHSVKEVLIAGGGTVSQYLARQLLADNISVKIIEANAERCDQLADALPGAIIINGDASDKDLLLEEGLLTAGAFLALTGFDEENIILSLYAKEMTDAKVVTKVDKIEFNEVINKLNLDSVVYPGDITAENILKYVRSKQNAMGNNVENLYKLVEDKVEALEFKISDNAPVIGHPIKELNLKSNLIICGIIHKGKLILPAGDSIIEAGDSIIVVTSQKKLSDVGDILR
ncbi:MAG: Trk system potassium transporter TrkA [Clostridia bacterium]|nr:Trk system potassium transporter TrkA [Clostridia bacterium]